MLIVNGIVSCEWFLNSFSKEIWFNENDVDGALFTYLQKHQSYLCTYCGALISILQFLLTDTARTQKITINSVVLEELNKRKLTCISWVHMESKKKTQTALIFNISTTSAISSTKKGSNRSDGFEMGVSSFMYLKLRNTQQGSLLYLRLPLKRINYNFVIITKHTRVVYFVFIREKNWEFILPSRRRYARIINIRTINRGRSTNIC